MALSTATITFDIANLLGVDFEVRYLKVWATTNVPGETVIDTAGNQIRIGTGTATVNENGTGSLTVWKPGAGSNPASWQTTIHVSYPGLGPTGAGTRTVRDFGPFTLTADADLADLVAEQEVPPEYAVGILAEMTALRDEAQAIIDSGGGGGGGTTPDATTTVKGKVELATNAETVTGTDAVRATTPAGVAAAMAAHPSLPTGGTSGQTLIKNTTTDGDASWTAIPASKRALGGPSYNVTPAAFPNWRAKLSAVRASISTGGSPAFAEMLVIGDSTAAGTESSGSDAHTKAWASLMAQLMDSYYVPTQRSGTWGAGTTGNSVADARVTIGSGWAQAAGLKILGNGGWMAGTGASGTLSFAQTFPVDTFVITYVGNAGLGTTVVKSDGVTIGTLNTAAGGSLDTLQATYTVTKGTHTLTLDPPTVAGVYIDKIEAYDSTRPSVRFSLGAKGGTKVVDFNAAGATAEHWYSKPALAPDLTLVSLTVNDAQAATDLATYTASMTTLINNLKGVGSDVLLVVGPPAYNDASNVALTPYVNALYTLCDTLNVGMVDTMARFGSYAISNPYGYYDGASLHLSALGNADLGQGVFNALKTL